MNSRQHTPHFVRQENVRKCTTIIYMCSLKELTTFFFTYFSSFLLSHILRGLNQDQYTFCRHKIISCPPLETFLILRPESPGRRFPLLNLTSALEVQNIIEELNTKRPTFVFFLAPSKPLQSYVQASQHPQLFTNCFDKKE